jgi:hypothetical protein
MDKILAALQGSCRAVLSDLPTPEGGQEARITVHISMVSAAAETPPPASRTGFGPDRARFDGVMRALQDALEGQGRPATRSAV